MSHSEVFLYSVSAILVLGVGSSWLASRLKVPGILLLLTVGCLAGGVFKLINPDEIFGESLLPAVSLAVGFILFEGGMTLKLAELKRIWRSILGLLTIGVLVTWVLATIFAFYILQMPFTTSLVFAGVLTVTGPTVIGPLLRDIRPKGNVGAVAKWEGIVIDPVGATLAVLVFEATESIAEARFESATFSALYGFFMTALIGSIIGAICSYVLVECLRRFWIPDHLRVPVTMMFVAIGFSGAEYFQHEAGLVSVTLMGIWLANQKKVDVHHILEFKETMTVLLICVLFITLASRIELSQLQTLSWRGPLFVVALIAIVRPVSVYLSTLGTSLTSKEKAFLAFFAPRGIVAAAVSSVFALRMGEEGALIVPAMFTVILMTVAIYGLGAGPLARKLGLAVANPQGLLIAGSNRISREISKALNASGFDTLIVDNSYEQVAKARDMGLRVQYANILSDYVVEELDLGGIGRFLGLTSNNKINTLACVRFRTFFGNPNIYQFSYEEARSSRHEIEAMHSLEGRNLFGNAITYDRLDKLLESGWSIRQTRLTASYTWDGFKEKNPEAIVLFFIRNKGPLNVVVAGDKIESLGIETRLIFIGPKTNGDDPRSNQDNQVNSSSVS